LPESENVSGSKPVILHSFHERRSYQPEAYGCSADFKGNDGENHWEFSKELEIAVLMGGVK
jgi:hypothetical protein